MLRIEKDCHGCLTRLLLSGRIQSDDIVSVQTAMSGCCERKILDLREVTLVDLEVVRFQVSCEDEGIELCASGFFASARRGAVGKADN